MTLQVLVMRHGVAVERDEWFENDALRPLTSDGKHKTRAVCRGLKRLTKIDFLASSPLMRAVQTAEIVRETFNYPDEITIWPALETMEFAPTLQHLRELSAASTCSALLVGHEPHLSEFIARLVFDSSRGDAIIWKKAGVCCVEIAFSPRSHSAQLQWFLTPKQLRLLDD